MGIVTMGVPVNITLELAKLANANVLIETGTFTGQTARWAANYFEYVYTIEKSDEIYAIYAPTFDNINGLSALLGDARIELPKILNIVKDRNVLYWLDSHWSGGITAGINDECPLLDELSIIAERTHDLILIDDARLFLSSPPEPHNPDQWPKIDEILMIINRKTKRYIQIIDDVIFATPNTSAFRDTLTRYGRQRC
jgi:hypothetical protein